MTDQIVVTRQPPGDAVARLKDVGDVWLWSNNSAIPRDVLVDKVSSADGLYCMLTDRIDAELLDAAPSLRVVSTMAVGVDNIDLEACKERGVAVGHTPGVLTDTTADTAWALLMASSRRLDEAIRHVKDGAWGPWDPAALLGLDVSRTTIGIIGMGRIGAAVARRAAGFNMEIVYASPFTNEQSERETGASQIPLDELLERSDHVVVSTALTEETRGLMGAEAFAKMKPTANLVNIARGPIVDTDALYQALTTGEIRCAGLDVTDPEPIPADHPLVGLDNCLIIPHLGSASERTRIDMADLAAANLIAGLAGDPLPARMA